MAGTPERWWHVKNQDTSEHLGVFTTQHQALHAARRALEADIQADPDRTSEEEWRRVSHEYYAKSQRFDMLGWFTWSANDSLERFPMGSHFEVGPVSVWVNHPKWEAGCPQCPAEK